MQAHIEVTDPLLRGEIEPLQMQIGRYTQQRDTDILNGSSKVHVRYKSEIGSISSF